MTRTLDVNGFLSHVDVVPRAMSDRHGEVVKFFIPNLRGMNALVVEAESTEGRTIETETDTIDHLTKEWPKVDVVKIDVEGSEEAVWRGMKRVLTENRDITIVLEVNAARYSDPVAFLQEIESFDFPLRYIDTNGDPRHIAKSEIVSTDHDWLLLLRRDPESSRR